MRKAEVGSILVCSRIRSADWFVYDWIKTKVVLSFPMPMAYYDDGLVLRKSAPVTSSYFFLTELEPGIYLPSSFDSILSLSLLLPPSWKVDIQI